jgi:hypothetical protein
MKLKLVRYSKLNSRQKESYNFQKVSALLADFGFTTLHLSDDWKGADFIAKHVSGATLFVQLKSRLTINKKYSKATPYYVNPPVAGLWIIGRILTGQRSLYIAPSRSLPGEGAGSVPR